MDYEAQLRAKLDAVRPVEKRPENIVDTQTLESRLLDELGEALEFSRYDLDESDLLRALKILNILERYPELASKEGLTLFYVLARVEVISPKSLHRFAEIPAERFKRILNAMARYKLVSQSPEGELELTDEGKSLAERIGIDIFF